MSNSYNLTQKIHELLPKINQKFGLKVEVIGNWQNHPQKGLFLATEKMEVMGKENWQKFLDECCLAIQAPQLRQILVSLQDVLGIKADKFEKKNLCLTHDLNGRLILPLFDQDPETVLTELVEILENLLK
jgi:hypothetical protein